jgi:hypothetical protein
LDRSCPGTIQASANSRVWNPRAFINELRMPAFRVPQLHGKSPVRSLCHPIFVGHTAPSPARQSSTPTLNGRHSSRQVPIGQVTRLAQVQEPGGACCEAGSSRRGPAGFGVRGWRPPRLGAPPAKGYISLGAAVEPKFSTPLVGASFCQTSLTPVLLRLTPNRRCLWVLELS